MTVLRKIIASVLLLLSASWTTGAQACATVSVVGPLQVDYDINSTLATVNNIQIRFDRTCTDAEVPDAGLPVEFWFSDADQPPPYGAVGGVDFLLRRRGVNLLTTPNRPLLSFPTYILGGNSGVLDIELALLPGFASQNDTRGIKLNWRTRGPNGEVLSMSQDVVVSVNTLPSFAISLANGGQSGELNFGTLTPGDKRNIGISATATHPFRISLDAVYGDVLRRTDACGVALPMTDDPHEQIAISTKLAGEVISETQPYLNFQPSGIRLVSFADLNFEVQIDPAFSPQLVRAGQYCNVLTLSISPAS